MALGSFCFLVEDAELFDPGESLAIPRENKLPERMRGLTFVYIVYVTFRSIR